MEAYHDTEWGTPLHDDRRHFEFLVLEGAQAGLSWRTVLQRREGYRRAFAGFDPEKVARFTQARIEKLLADPGIIRNRQKVNSAVTNARALLKVQNELGSFDSLIWRFVGGSPIVNARKMLKDIPALTPESEALSKELIRRGFTFVGPTIVYAHMQACGLVNDHLVDCYRRRPLAPGREAGLGREEDVIGATEIKRGDILDIDGAPWQVTDVSVQTPSARGASMLVKVKTRSLRTGQSIARTYRGNETVDVADCEKRPVQFLYRQEDEFVFMDQGNYEQFTLLAEALGDGVGYLTDGLELGSLLYNGEVLTVELPVTVELLVVDTAPAIKGATAQAQLKPATLETGIEVLVPPYLTTGERIKVDTRDGRFVERVK